MSDQIPRPDLGHSGPAAWLSESEWCCYEQGASAHAAWSRVIEARRALHEAQQEGARLVQEINKLGDVCGDLQEADEVIERLGKERDEARKEAADLRDRLATVRSLTGEASQLSEAVGAHIHEVTADLRECRAECEGLRARIGRAEGLEEAREALVMWRQARDNEGDVVWLSSAIPVLTSALAAHDLKAADVARLEAENATLHQGIARVEGEAAEMLRERDHLAKILSAEQGKPEGAASEGWEWTGIMWVLTEGGIDVARVTTAGIGRGRCWAATVYDGSADLQRSIGQQRFDLALTAMEAADTARSKR